MIVLDYRLSASWRSDAEDDLSSVDLTDLRYRLFLGDVIFRIDDADFSAPWGWVPVLDFAAGLRWIARSLESRDEEVFEFTDSDATLRFVRRNGTVSITSNYAKGRMEAGIPYKEFCRAVAAFFDKLIRDLYLTHPELSANRAMGELREP